MDKCTMSEHTARIDAILTAIQSVIHRNHNDEYKRAQIAGYRVRLNNAIDWMLDETTEDNI